MRISLICVQRITWRVYLVFQKPLDDLEDVLGIDVPPVPEISLSSITKDAILLYWKPPDNYHSPLRQCIQINGVNIEEFEHSDGSVQLAGLQPGHSYGIRAIATNNAGNSTYSRLIQVQTIPRDGNGGVKQLAEADQHHSRRNVSARRVSQPIPHNETLSTPTKQDLDVRNGGEAGESIVPLNARLDALRQSKDEVELDLKREMEESESQKLALYQNRDRVKERLEDQEKEFQEKRKQVNELEKQLKSSQRRKQTKEKSLQQKKTEKQKMQDDIERWMEESVEMEEKIGTLNAQKVTLEGNCSQKMQQMQEKITAIVGEIKSLDEEIKELGIKVNESRKTARVMQDEEDKDSERREQLHEMRMAQLDADFRAIYTEHYQYDADFQRMLEYRTSLAEDRLKNPARYAMLPGVEYSSHLGPVRRNRTGSRMGTSRFGGQQYSTGMSFNTAQNLFQSSPLSMNTRMAYLGPLGSARHQDIDSLTGGALVSPSANQLLPKNLLGDVDEDYISGPGAAEYPHIDTLGQRSGSWDQDPQSPQSMYSASHSALNSPHESFTSIPNLYSIDADGNSVNSTGSPYLQNLTATADTSGSRRRSNIFGFGRQRPKSSVYDLPPLGSLKTGQSQSFPLTPDSEPSARKKNGYSVWASPMANLLSRGTTSVGDDGPETPNLSRKTKRGIFGSKLDPSEVLNPFDRSSSPRPPSTSSHDIGLPRPSSDSNPFGWINTEGMRQRASPLGGDWAAASGTTGWSRSQSRQPSVQFGSASNLSLGSIPIDLDEFGMPYKATQPAPIGTERFNIKTKTKVAPRLNPAAPSFTARLFTKKEKTPKSDLEADGTEPVKVKSKGKGKGKKEKAKDKNQDIRHATSSEFDTGKISEDGSTSHSHTSPRLSRDTYSYTQDDESQSSMPETAPVNSTESQNLSTPTSAVPAKETLMQRITRKSSSSKFSAAWKERGGLFTSKKGGGEPTTPGDLEEDASSDYLGKGSAPDSTTAPGSTLGTPIIGAEKEKTGRLSSSWGRVMSMTGKAKIKSALDKEEKERESLESEDINDE